MSATYSQWFREYAGMIIQGEENKANVVNMLALKNPREGIWEFFILFLQLFCKFEFSFKLKEKHSVREKVPPEV